METILFIIGVVGLCITCAGFEAKDSLIGAAAIVCGTLVILADVIIFYLAARGD